MEGYSVYVFILCLLVFVMLGGVCSAMLTIIVKSSLRIIKIGAEDEKIKAEYEKAQAKKGKVKGLDYALSLILCLVLCAIFVFSLYVNLRKDSFSDKLPTFQVVQSGSMSKKHENNGYLEQNNLNDQFQTFDIILTYKAPKESEIKLYDVVVYEVDGRLIVHRVIGIEEPNSNHPNERWFLCQGDANSRSDRFPVKYQQIKGIYRGEHIAFVGSFVLFFQSPAGWICILFVAAFTVITPILEKKFKKAKDERLKIIAESEKETTAEGEISTPVEVVSCDTAESVVTDAPMVEDAPEVKESAPEPLVTTVIEEKIVEKVRVEVVEKEPETVYLEKIRVIEKKSFDQRLRRASKEMKQRYKTVTDYIKSWEKVREIESDNFRTFRIKNKPVAKISMRGKTINVHLALSPSDYTESKYIFQDVSEIRKYALYPMRVRLTSDRQAKWTCELIDKVFEQYGIEKGGAK